MRRHGIRTAVAALAVLGMGVAACSSDKKQAATTTAGPTTSAAPDNSTGGTDAGPTTTARSTGPAKGEPIRVGFINSTGAALSTVTGTAGAYVAVDYINEELGGVHGRPLALTVCNVTGTPESSVSCSNQLVDKKPVVVVRHSDSGDTAGIPIIRAAGIPYYTIYGAGGIETATDGVFNFSGSLSNYISFAKYAQQKGWKKVGVLAIGVSAVQDGWDKYGKASFGKYGVAVNFVTFAPAAADLSPEMKAAADGAAVVLIVGAVTHCVAGINAYKALGLTMPIMLHSVCWNDTVLKALPNGGKGSYLIGDDTSPLADDADNKVFVAQMKKRQPDAVADGLAALGFLGLINLQRVLNTIPAGTEITPATVEKAFRAVKDLPLFMMHGAKATCDGKQVPGLVSICHAGYWIGPYDGTKVTVEVDIDAVPLLKEILGG